MSARRIALALALLGVAACAGVLGLRDRREAPFAHRAHVVAGVSCLRCHGGVERAGDEGPLHLPADATCTSAGCHSRPHDSRPCLTCHATPWAQGAAAEARSHLRFSHASHLPALHGNCARCHSEVAAGDGPLRPRMATCLSCHAHQDQFRPQACDVCHVDLETERSAPSSHVVHDGDWLREHGVRAAADGELCAACHGERQCASCHGATTPMLPARRRFDDPMAASVHRAGFRARHGEEAAAQPGTCTACHAERSCQGCHQREGVAGTGAASPHPTGWVGLDRNEHGRAARRDPASCAACHGGAGEALCVSCHKVGGIGGNPHPPGWRDDRPLSQLPCRSCHVR
jgi:hypothetical protein